MDLTKQRLSNTFENTDSSPPLAPVHKEGLRGICYRLILVAIFILISSGITIPAHAGQAVLTWDPPTTNTDGTTLTDLAGYKVYYGTTSGSYSTVIDANNVNSYTVAGLIENITYYFATTAYTSSGNESSYSNEVSKAIAASTLFTTEEWVEVEDCTIVSPMAISVESGITYISTPSADQGSASCTFTVPSDGTYYINTNVKAVDGVRDSFYVYTSGVTTDTAEVWDAIYELGGYPDYIEDYVTRRGTGTFGNPEDDPRKFNLTQGTVTITFTGREADTRLDRIMLTSGGAPSDTTPPVISSVSTSNVTTSMATITWSTDEAATSQVEYGTTTSYGSSTTLNTNLVTSHSVSLSSLSSSTLYHYRIRSTDAAGNLATSGDYTFTTTAASDTTAPVISNISTGSITSAAATVTWTTDEASTSRAEYGTSTNYGSFSNPDSNLVTSHTVTLSGLTPNSIYYFRVLSSDQAGNQGTSTGSNFTTQNVSQADTPTAINDLAVRAGSSTRNSVILDWTATGSDGTEGTASAYDLRMSTQKIIDDGLTPLQGEINFSNATRITSLSVPKIAGSSESFQVTQLETNNIYYFAIKVIDDKGNISEISNVVNGDSVPPVPVSALRQGYTIISFPLIPETPDVQTLLGGILGNPVELYWWNSSGLGDAGAFVAETHVVPGYGYFVKSNIDTATLNITGTVVTDESRSIPLQPGWNMIGNPYPQEVLLRNTFVRQVNTGDLKNYQDAVIAGWISNAIYRYNGSTYDFELYNTGTLKLWHGYWLTVLMDGQYEIIIYKP